MILPFLANHLWQSTCVAVAVAIIAWLFRHKRARVRHALWLVASLKFLVPFGLLGSLGSALPWPATAAAPFPPAVLAVEAITQPFSVAKSDATVDNKPLADAAHSSGILPLTLMTVWIAGSAGVCWVRWKRWRQAAVVVRSARRLRFGREVDAWDRVRGNGIAQLRPVTLLMSAGRVEPCVFGVFSPVLLWPEQISERLTDAQLDAIAAHELCHIRLRHNLAAAAQTVVEIIFWFHPLVWWIGRQLVDERERTCDEEVLRLGNDPVTYADSILKVCEFSVATALASPAGITGSHLVQRIEAIMSHRNPDPLSWWQRALLAATAIVALLTPVVAGAAAEANRPLLLQALPSPSIKADTTIARLDAPDGRLPQSPAPTATAGPAARAGSVSGTVVDQTGGFVPGVSVNLTSVSNASDVRAVVTNALGRYTFANVPAGAYEISFARPGFKMLRDRVQVSTGLDVAYPAKMQLGSVTESITIRATAGETRAPSPTMSEAQLLDQIARDPQTASNYLQLAQLYYTQERWVDSERAVAQAVDLIGRQASGNRPTAVAAGQTGGTVNPPRKIKDSRPIYPAAALASQTSGAVILEAKIGDDGTVKDPRILRSVPLLDEAAIGAVRQWLFTPTLLNGVPVEVSMTVTLTFEITK